MLASFSKGLKSYVPELSQHGHIGQVGEGYQEVEGRESNGFHHSSSDNGAHGIGNRIGYIRYGIDTAINRDVTHIHQITQCGQ